MKILDQGIVYDAASAPGHRRFCAFTNVTVLSGGRVLCAYVHRHRPPSLRAILSSGFGQTWDMPDELVFYEHPFGPQAGMDVPRRGFTDYYADQGLWNFGHVEPGLLPDGSIFAAFYAGDTQSLSVRWARFEL